MGDTVKRDNFKNILSNFGGSYANSSLVSVFLMRQLLSETWKKRQVVILRNSSNFSKVIISGFSKINSQNAKEVSKLENILTLFGGSISHLTLESNNILLYSKRQYLLSVKKIFIRNANHFSKIVIFSYDKIILQNKNLIKQTKQIIDHIGGTLGNLMLLGNKGIKINQQKKNEERLRVFKSYSGYFSHLTIKLFLNLYEKNLSKSNIKILNHLGGSLGNLMLLGNNSIKLNKEKKNQERLKIFKSYSGYFSYLSIKLFLNIYENNSSKKQIKIMHHLGGIFGNLMLLGNESNILNIEKVKEEKRKIINNFGGNLSLIIINTYDKIINQVNIIDKKNKNITLHLGGILGNLLLTSNRSVNLNISKSKNEKKIIFTRYSSILSYITIRIYQKIKIQINRERSQSIFLMKYFGGILGNLMLQGNQVLKINNDKFKTQRVNILERFVGNYSNIVVVGYEKIIKQINDEKTKKINIIYNFGGMLGNFMLQGNKSVITHFKLEKNINNEIFINRFNSNLSKVIIYGKNKIIKKFIEVDLTSFNKNLINDFTKKISNILINGNDKYIQQYKSSQIYNDKKFIIKRNSANLSKIIISAYEKLIYQIRIIINKESLIKNSENLSKITIAGNDKYIQQYKRNQIYNDKKFIIKRNSANLSKIIISAYEKLIYQIRIIINKEILIKNSKNLSKITIAGNNKMIEQFINVNLSSFNKKLIHNFVGKFSSYAIVANEKIIKQRIFKIYVTKLNKTIFSRFGGELCKGLLLFYVKYKPQVLYRINYLKINNKNVFSRFGGELSKIFLSFNNKYKKQTLIERLRHDFDEDTRTHCFFVDDINQLNKKYINYFRINYNGLNPAIIKNKNFYLSNCNVSEHENVEINVQFVDKQLESDFTISEKGRPMIQVDLILKDKIMSLTDNNREKTINCSINVVYKVIEKSPYNTSNIAFKKVDTIKIAIKLKLTNETVFWNDVLPYTISDSTPNNITIQDKTNEMVEVEVFNKNSLIDLVNYVNNYKFIIPSDDDNIGNKIQYTKIQYEPNIDSLFNLNNNDISYNCIPDIDTHVKNISIDSETGIIKPFLSLVNRKFLIDNDQLMDNVINSGNNGLVLEISNNIAFNSNILNSKNTKDTFNLHMLILSENSRFTIKSDINLNIIDLRNNNVLIDLDENSINLEENFFDLISVHKVNFFLDSFTTDKKQIIKEQNISFIYERIQGISLVEESKLDEDRNNQIIPSRILDESLLNNNQIIDEVSVKETTFEREDTIVNSLLIEPLINEEIYYPGWVVYEKSNDYIGINTILHWTMRDVIQMKYVLPLKDNYISQNKENGYYTFNNRSENVIWQNSKGNFINNNNYICNFKTENSKMIDTNSLMRPYYRDDEEFRLNPINGTIYFPSRWPFKVKYFSFYLTVSNHSSRENSLIHKQRIIINKS